MIPIRATLPVLKRMLWGTLILSILFLFFSTQFWVYEDTWEGHIQKLNKEGILFTTFEGSIRMSRSALYSDSIQPFSIASNNIQVYNTLEKASDSTKIVKVSYRARLFPIFYQGNSKYFVYKIVSIIPSSEKQYSNQDTTINTHILDEKSLENTSEKHSLDSLASSIIEI